MSLLPLKTFVNAQSALYSPAGSGGGGSSGAVLNVSTINFNSVGSAGNIPAQQNMRNGGAGGLAGFNGAVLAFDMDPGPVSTMIFGYNTANNSLQITQFTNDIPSSGALQVDALQGISSIQSGYLTVSTMLVSSINNQELAYKSYLSSLFAANPTLSTILY